jgi:photosystem II stability/assembly factor-like uncharacterized protein
MRPVVGALPHTAVVPSAIAFWDARHGLLAANSCPRSGGSCRTGTISLTADGGRTFRVVLHTRRQVLALQTAGPAAAIAELDQGHALRTLDGGRSWRPFRLRYHASFATPRVGLGFRTALVGNRLVLTLLATSDGGRSWRARASPCRQALADTALVDLVTPRLGWLVCLGEPGAGSQQKAVYRTIDGGRSWQLGAETIFYPHPRVHGGISIYGYPYGIAFAPDGFGILWEGRGTVYVTRNGGRRWTAQPSVARPEIDFGRGAAAFPDGHAFLLLGRGGGPPTRLLATPDHGRTWQTVHRWG